MKTITLALISFCLLFILSGCENTKKSNERLPSDITKKSVKNEASKIQELTIYQSADWSTINNGITGKCITPYLVEHKISIDCTPCRKLRWVYTFHINGSGQLLKMEKDDKVMECNLNKEQIKELENLIETYLKKQIMPLSLHNTIFKAGIGFTLKC